MNIKTYYAQESEDEVLAFDSKKGRDGFVYHSVFAKSITAKEAYKIVPQLRKECPSLCNNVVYVETGYNNKSELGQLLLGYALLLLAVGIVALGIVSLLTQDTTVLNIYNSVGRLFQSIG